nr:alpha-defensin 1-like [Desmodus rotundus]
MRTLTLLAALFLLAFQAQAQTLQETVDQLPAQDQPGDKDQDQPGDKDQDQPGDEDQDVAIYFTGDGRITRNAAGLRRIRCQCRRTTFCNFFERYGGRCRLSGRGYKLCCH